MIVFSLVNRKIKSVRTRHTTKELFLSFVFLTLFSPLISAQNRLSADVLVRQLSQNKLTKIQKEIFFSSNGNLVVHYTYPIEYYVITNLLGKNSIYLPSKNEVMYIDNWLFSSNSEIITCFFKANYSDLNLTNIGFTLQSSQKEGDNIVSIYVPNNNSIKTIKKVKIVCQKDKPIYSAFYTKKDKIATKTFYTNYITLPNVSFPTTITQILYDEKGDSIIRKEEIENIKTNDFPNENLFDFQIPENAKRVNSYYFMK